ncbi:FAD-dependent oxidoreductase [Paenibacillus sp. TRM 82003]|uniref:FAD-dependent oxidoreductase n=1 Tax=Kineococcus sp. TRM81007 TaxID=2925831 RepID=UPI001F583610|nr:FAD-dependent oxidoreductase [Kineococcus sp. TRM81007]MCI2239817.1 FAD-dependent oxidoreductase [Kineococcus sp. TRM81007]MCI3925880.1 FAD-dependent oxidoreductase [Paenibacillus sp. TRM 82003]
MRTLEADLLVLGGGLGGVAAALTAARLGHRVVLVERSGWLGGQLTTQAVPPDEHQWIEGEHSSPAYRRLRELVREHYRRTYPLLPRAAADPTLNPGLGYVSRLCCEPRVAALAVEELLSPAQGAGLLTVLRRTALTAVQRDGERIGEVLVHDLADGRPTRLLAPLVADATELGDVLELAGVEHVVGAEARSRTGEPHAPEVADPMDQQAVTWCCALEFRAGEDHTVERPAGYEHWRTAHDPRWPGPQLSFDDVVPETLARRTRPLFAADPILGEQRPQRDLWQYRRLLARTHLDPSFAGGEVTCVNWPQTDYWELPLLGVDAATRERALAGARELTLSFVHWLQTEAPRHDGGTGYPELRLRGDVTGTADGLAQEVYVRESRRVLAERTVTELDVGRLARGDGAGSAEFTDSVGIGYYRIDLHPSTSGRTYVDIDCFPFQVPLGALLPRDVVNLLAAAKNIGTTHVTNGAYRLHPVEFTIGEAVGALAAYCAEHGAAPSQVRADPAHLERYQGLLSGTLGVPLAWPEEIRRFSATHDVAHVTVPS